MRAREECVEVDDDMRLLFKYYVLWAVNNIEFLLMEERFM